MNTRQLVPSALVLAVLALGPATVSGWSGTDQVAWPEKKAFDTEDWPRGVLGVVNDQSRGPGWNPWFSGWPNDTDYYELNVRTIADVNRIVGTLGKIEAKTIQIRLEPGEEPRALAFTTVLPAGNRTGAMFAIGKQPVIDAWHARLPEVAPGVRQFGTNRYLGPPPALPPTLTLYVRHKAIDLNKLDVPMGVEVEAAVTDEYRKRHKDDPFVKAIDRFVTIHRDWRKKGKGTKPLTEPYPTAAPARGEEKVKPAPADPRPLAPFKGHAAPVSSAVFSADGTTLVTTDTDGTIKVWDARTGEERSTIKRFSTQVTKRPAKPVTLAVSPDGATMATSLADDVPRLWSTETGRERTVLRREPEHGLVMAFSPDGRTLAFRSLSSAVDFWDVDREVNGQRVKAPHQVRRIEVKAPKFMLVAAQTPLTFSPDGKTLAAVTPDRTVVLWETSTGKELARITELTVKLEIKDRNETAYQPLTEERLRAFRISRPFTFDDVGLAFSPDGKTLALSGPEITLWDTRTGKKSGTLPGRGPGGLPPGLGSGFARVAFSADGKTLTSAGSAESPLGLKPLPVRELWTGEPTTGSGFVGVWVRQWELSAGRETAAAVIRVNNNEPKGTGPREWFVALSPDLTRLATPGPDNAVRVWNVAALRPVPAKKDEKPGQEKVVSGVVTAVSESSVTVGGESYKLTKDTRYSRLTGRDPTVAKAGELVKGKTVDLVVADGVVVEVFFRQFGHLEPGEAIPFPSKEDLLKEEKLQPVPPKKGQKPSPSGSAPAMPPLLDIVPLPKHAHEGVRLSVTEGKDGELVVKLGLEDKQLRFPVGGVSVAVYEKGPDGKARLVTRFSPAARQKDGLTQTHFTVQRRYALNTTIGLDTEAPWPGGLRVTFALTDFVDFGKDVPDVARAELLPFTLNKEDESTVERDKKVRPHRAP